MLPVDGANILLGLVAIVAVASTVWSMGCVLWVTRRRKGLADHTPPVTIFKPLKGMDEGLEENLRSFFHLDYPVYQLIFGVAEADDPAIEVVRKLQAEYPGHDTALVVGTPAFGLNPKVENLAAMDRHRKHDVILISDSNVRVRPSYLRETACYLAEPGVGLVSNLFVGVGESYSGAVMENLQLNGFIAGGVAGAAVMRITGVIGKSMLMPVAALEAIGGLAAVRNLLAEDQAITACGSGRAGYLDSPAEPPRHRQRELPAELPLVPQPPLAVVQDPPPDDAAVVRGRAGGQPDHGRAGLGVLGRVVDRLGRADAAGRAGHRPRRLADAMAARVVPQAAASALQPGQGHPAAVGLVRRDLQPPGAVARPQLPRRADDPPPPRPRPPSGAPSRPARAATA